MKSISLHQSNAGHQLGYELNGPQDGYPLVFLNGILMNLRSWSAQVSHFSKEFRCLTHDFCGQLYSSKNVPEQLKLEMHAEDVLSLLDELQIERCHLVGTSYGGEVGLLFAKAYPERVRSLSVIASVSYSGALLRRQVALWKKLAMADKGLLYDAVVSTSYSNRFLERHGNFLDMRRANFKELPADFFQAFRRLCEAFLQFQLPAEELAQITCPCLVVGASLDILKPPYYSQYIATHLPDAALELIDKAGHAVVVEKPKAVNALLRRFIEKN